MQQGDEDEQVLFKEFYLLNTDKAVLDFDAELFAVTPSATPYINADAKHTYCEVRCLPPSSLVAPCLVWSWLSVASLVAPMANKRCASQVGKSMRVVQEAESG